MVEQILSGRIVERQAYAQEQDEWVALLAGSAVLEVDGEEVVVETGDWLFLPAGVAHTVTTTEPGTSWLAVHLYPG